MELSMFGCVSSACLYNHFRWNRVSSQKRDSPKSGRRLGQPHEEAHVRIRFREYSLHLQLTRLCRCLMMVESLETPCEWRSPLWPVGILENQLCETAACQAKGGPSFIGWIVETMTKQNICKICHPCFRSEVESAHSAGSAATATVADAPRQGRVP